MKLSTALIGFFALLGIVGAAQGAGDAVAGKAKAAACADCHGANGEGDEAPKIAGLPEAQLRQAMQDYKSGKRPDAGMKASMGKLSEQDLQDLAAYYASQK
jgi:cytochrome c553